MTEVIRVKAKRSERLLEKMRISLVDCDRILAGPIEHQGILGAAGIEIPLNFRPEHAGLISVQLRIESFLEDSTEAEVRLVTLLLPVDSAGGHRGGGPSIVIHAPNNTGLLTLPNLAEQPGPLQKYYVAATSKPRVESLVLQATPTRLTLAMGETRLHAISRAPAWFGRQKERPEKGRPKSNAVVLQVFSPDGTARDSSTDFISRTHFLVEREGSRCRLRDGAPARDKAENILPGGPVTSSANGLAVEGTRLPPRGIFSLAAGQEAEVALAPGKREGGVLSLRLSGVPDAFESSACAGALVRRNDAVAEAYLPMWGAVDLGAADAALGGWILSWDGARFLLRDPSGDERALAAGRTFGPPERPVRVLPFSQTGI